MFTGAPQQVAADLDTWEAAGVATLIVRLPVADPNGVAESLAEFAETVVALRG